MKRRAFWQALSALALAGKARAEDDAPLGGLAIWHCGRRWQGRQIASGTDFGRSS